MAILSQDQFDQQVLALINAERSNEGLASLTLVEELDAASDQYAQRLATGDFLDHVDPSTNSKPWDRAEAAGYDQWTTVGENIAAGYQTPETVVDGWMNSPLHRDNILDASFTHTGIGYYYLANDTGQSNWNHYWVQKFGSGDPTPGTYSPESSSSETLNVTIIDNDDPDFSTDGTWHKSVLKPSFNGNARYNSAGVGNDSATWNFTGLAPDVAYIVGTTWSAHSNRATDSPFTITGGVNPFTVDVNQELSPNDFTFQGKNWEALGTVTPTSSTLTVELTDDANQFVVADAVGIIPLGSPTIIDDGDSGFSKFGRWRNSGVKPSFNSDSLFNSAGVGHHTAQWDFTGVSAGTYLISASWSAHSNRATDSPFTIIGGTSPITVEINQEIAPNDFVDLGYSWEILGSVTISGDSISVLLSDDANQYVVADAIRIDPLSFS